MEEKKSNNIVEESSTSTVSSEHVIGEKPKHKFNKKLFSILFISLNVIIIIAIGITSFSGNEEISFDQVFNTLLSNWKYLLLALLAIIVVLGAESLKYFVLIYKTTHRFRIWLSIKIAVLGKYYDNITPLGSGGQPFQIYYLTKNGVPLGVSTSLPVASFFMMQLAFIVLCVTVFITNSVVVESVTIRVCAYIGAIFSIFIPVMLIMFAIFPKATNKMLRFFLRVGSKIKIVKNPDKFELKIQKLVSDYRNSLKVVGTSKRSLSSTFILSLIYQVALCSIPFFVIRACGDTSTSWFDSLSMCVFAYAAISFIPTPGNSGAAEGVFYLMFTMLGSGYIFFGMSLWRFYSYYLVLIIGLVFLFINFHSEKKEAKSEVLEINRENPESS